MSRKTQTLRCNVVEELNDGKIMVTTLNSLIDHNTPKDGTIRHEVPAPRSIRHLHTMPMKNFCPRISNLNLTNLLVLAIKDRGSS